MNSKIRQEKLKIKKCKKTRRDTNNKLKHLNITTARCKTYTERERERERGVMMNHKVGQNNKMTSNPPDPSRLIFTPPANTTDYSRK
jgi:hypothetical protein